MSVGDVVQEHGRRLWSGGQHADSASLASQSASRPWPARWPPPLSRSGPACDRCAASELVYCQLPGRATRRWCCGRCAPAVALIGSTDRSRVRGLDSAGSGGRAVTTIWTVASVHSRHSQGEVSLARTSLLSAKSVSLPLSLENYPPPPTDRQTDAQTDTRRRHHERVSWRLQPAKGGRSYTRAHTPRRALLPPRQARPRMPLSRRASRAGRARSSPPLAPSPGERRAVCC
jgi:hypothetical protein